MSSFAEVYDPFCTVCLGIYFIYFQKIQNVEPYLQIIQIPDPRKSVLGPGDVFACFLNPNNHQFIYNIANFL